MYRLELSSCDAVLLNQWTHVDTVIADTALEDHLRSPVFTPREYDIVRVWFTTFGYVWIYHDGEWATLSHAKSRVLFENDEMFWPAFSSALNMMKFLEDDVDERILMRVISRFIRHAMMFNAYKGENQQIAERVEMLDSGMYDDAAKELFRVRGISETTSALKSAISYAAFKEFYKATAECIRAVGWPIAKAMGRYNDVNFKVAYANTDRDFSNIMRDEIQFRDITKAWCKS